MVEKNKGKKEKKEKEKIEGQKVNDDIQEIERLEKKERIYGVHKLTDEEIRDKAKELGAKYQEKKHLENGMKSVKSEFQSKINACDAEIEVLSQLVRNGEEMRYIQCYIELNNVHEKRIYISIETDEIIKEENFRDEDYQRNLDLNDDKEEPKERENEEKDNPDNDDSWDK